MHASLVEQIRRRRRMMKTVTGRAPARRLRRKLPPQKHPTSVAGSYFAKLLAILERAKAMVDRRIVLRLPGLVRSAAAARGDARLDDKTSDINAAMDQLAEEFFAALSPSALDDLAAEIAIRTSDFQRRELGRQLQAALGVEVPFTDAGLRARIQDFVAENVSLIKSIPQRYFDQVEQRVIGGVRQGLRWEEIASQLEDRFGVAKSSAQLVARDQVGKFFGELNKARQQDLGIQTYTWRTMSDNRVRPEHEEREGESFKWNDPPEDGAPGQAINCRCWGEPDLSAILEDL